MTRSLALASLLALAALGPAQAQTDSVPNADDERTLACLSTPASPPRFYHYGQDSKREHTGVVRMELRFTAPDQPPEITVLAQTANDHTFDGAMAYVQAYRLPCLKPGTGALTAVQEFVFDPSDAPAERPVRLFLPDAEASERCLVRPRLDEHMAYSRLDRRQYLKVFARVSFQGGPEDAPVVTLTHSDASSAFTDGVLDFLKAHRMPCRKAGDKAQSFDHRFLRYPAGGRPSRFTQEQMTLADFLPNVQGIEQAKLYFDFNGMGCPFDVRWSLMQPTLPNGVHVSGKPNANRSEFLAWLRGVQLKMEPRRVKDLMGEGFKIQVQCGVLNLPGRT